MPAGRFRWDIVHIGFVTVPLQTGGAERVILEEANHFAAHEGNVSLIVPDYSCQFVDHFDLPENVSIVPYGASASESGSLNFLTETMAIYSVLKDVRPDVVFSHYKSTQLYVVNQLTDVSVPYVCHVHGSILWFENNAQLLPHERKDGFDRLIESVPGHREFQSGVETTPIGRAKAEVTEHLRERALHGSEVVFTGSNRVAEELETLYGVDAEVVHPGVSRHWLSERDSTTTESLMDCNRTILGLSRLDPRKRFDLLIESFAALRERHPDLGLVIGGVGPVEGDLKATARRLGVADHVRFAGFIPDDELPTYYKSAEIFACPAWMSYGLVPLEAYSMNTKVALSSDTYVKELLEGNEGVSVVDPTVDDWVDCLDALLEPEVNGRDMDVVPTWAEYCERKHRILVDRGVL